MAGFLFLLFVLRTEASLKDTTRSSQKNVPFSPLFVITLRTRYKNVFKSQAKEKFIKPVARILDNGA